MSDDAPGAAEPTAETPYREVWTTDEFREVVFENERPVIVDFWAAWCQPCIRMAPVFAELAAQHPEVQFVKVDSDRASAVSRAAGVRGLPTFGFYWQGEVRDVMVGAQTRAQLEKRVKWIKDIAAGKGFFARLLGR